MIKTENELNKAIDNLIEAHFTDDTTCAFTAEAIKTAVRQYDRKAIVKIYEKWKSDYRIHYPFLASLSKQINGIVLIGWTGRSWKKAWKQFKTFKLYKVHDTAYHEVKLKITIERVEK